MKNARIPGRMPKPSNVTKRMVEWQVTSFIKMAVTSMPKEIPL